MTEQNTLLITGASGFIGAHLLEHFAADPAPFSRIIATDIREIPEYLAKKDHIEFRDLDICDGVAVKTCFDEFKPRTVVHLAAMVTPPPGDHRELQFQVDVIGTRNVIEACISCGTDQFIYTSSGAAYGYHPDNSECLVEDDPVRGNEVFAYAHHKRIVEEELAAVRERHPELRQLIFRVSTVLGPRTDNQITSLFEQPVVTGIAGVDAPFCIIADQDVVGAIRHGIHSGKQGVFNLTGDGVLSLAEIARRMGNRYISIPEVLIRTALIALSNLGIGPYGPEQVLFLKHRPVLDNRKLKEEFGYRPKMTSSEAFERYRRTRSAPEEAEQSVVLLAGAGGDLGCALACEQADRGEQLVLVDRDQEALERVYMMVRAQGGEAIAVCADVTVVEDCQRAVDRAVEAFGEIDILFNHAGTSLSGPLQDIA